MHPWATPRSLRTQIPAALVTERRIFTSSNPRLRREPRSVSPLKFRLRFHQPADNQGREYRIKLAAILRQLGRVDEACAELPSVERAR